MRGHIASDKKQCLKARRVRDIMVFRSYYYSIYRYKGFAYIKLKYKLLGGNYERERL